MRFVRFLRACRNALFGVPHRHHWQAIQEIKSVWHSENEIPYARRYVMQCTGCGEIKTQKV